MGLGLDVVLLVVPVVGVVAVGLPVVGVVAAGVVAAGVVVAAGFGVAAVRGIFGGLTTTMLPWRGVVVVGVVGTLAPSEGSCPGPDVPGVAPTDPALGATTAVVGAASVLFNAA